MRVVVYTAVSGGFDGVWAPVEQTIPVDWVRLTDGNEGMVEPWQRRALPPWPGRCSRMVAKRPRMLPWEHFEDYDVAIWIDGNMAVTSPRFVEEAVRSVRHGMAIWKHPQRRCLFDEAGASVRLLPAKYGHTRVLEQADAYRALGHPARWGLYAAGTIVWDLHSSTARQIGELWLDECDRWSYQDQVSLPFVLRSLGVRPGVFPHRQINAQSLSNPWLTIHAHQWEEGQ